MDVIEYGKKILADHGCNEYTYGDEAANHIMDDLKEAYPDGMEFPYIDVANAILSISRPKPIVREPFMMVWDTEHCCDGFGCDSFEEAKAAMEDCYVEWSAEEASHWKNLEPTEEEKDNWDYMIWNCGCWIEKYNPDTDEYEEYYYMSDEELRSIGWAEWDIVKEMI